MSDQYLWDKTGPPDPDVQELENLLAPFRETPAMRAPARRRQWIWIPVGMAAATAVISFLAWRQMRPARPAWSVSGNVAQKELRAGEWLETGAGSRAQLDLESTGQVQVEPNSRLRVLAAGKDRQALSLAHGMIRATIWAPPGQFSVATPSATAVDLGCEYTLETDAQGTGTVHVEMGWVAFEDFGRESFIPAGAVCHTRPRRGPGIPYFESSAEPVQQLVAAFDERNDAALLASALLASTKQDGVTLWHLMRRLPQNERAVVFDRFAALLPVPASVTRDAIVRGDSKAVDALWDSLGYGDTEFWRTWKRREFSR